MASDHYMAVGVDQYIIDRDDEDCPEIGLHLAAWKGDAVQLEELLTCHKDHVQVEIGQTQFNMLTKYVCDNSLLQIDSRVRPFLSSPLRLAATGRECCAFDQKCDSYFQLEFDFLNKYPKDKILVRF